MVGGSWEWGRGGVQTNADTNHNIKTNFDRLRSTHAELKSA